MEIRVAVIGQPARQDFRSIAWVTRIGISDQKRRVTTIRLAR
jgi:hypothetical protein